MVIGATADEVVVALKRMKEQNGFDPDKLPQLLSNQQRRIWFCRKYNQLLTCFVTDLCL